ncbi:CCA tRNA nucleotidyltransferase [Corallococcus macrosporus]|uniref:Poly(A) polymerase n=1 Tax=Myxococcus fulvus (strain ATCC BAA-855 / HW-1) TaxID=483219 RepID=F8CLT2_MYXFH|nr:CCA tRNA nucleotidyltransferase [Corallococcus macrosporus]AEI67791.1 poly(A) polymerase [Corallococcus macrosporus]
MTLASPETRPQELDVSRIDPAALRVLQRLQEYGHQAFLVGGCVRDLLMGRTPKDFDLVTSASSRQVRALFPQSVGFGGQRFLVVQVRTEGGKSLEVASFKVRRSKNVSGPDAQVLPDDVLAELPQDVGTLEQDARTRDFTVNALYCNGASGRVLDPLGQGLSDLQANLLRIVGEPEEYLRDDPGGMLRGARFAARMGMAFEPRTAEAMNQMSGELARCSRKRVLSEVLRGLGTGTGAPFFRMLSSQGWLPLLVPPVARHLEGGPEVERRFFAHLEAVDRSLQENPRIDELTLACALLLPVAAPPAGGLPAPEAMGTVLEELVRGAPEFLTLPRHGQHLIATLHGVLKAPEAVPADNPLLPGARRLAALLG